MDDELIEIFLRGRDQLEHADFTNTNLSKDGVNRISKRFPNAKIKWSMADDATRNSLHRLTKNGKDVFLTGQLLINGKVVLVADRYSVSVASDKTYREEIKDLIQLSRTRPVRLTVYGPHPVLSNLSDFDKLEYVLTCSYSFEEKVELLDRRSTISNLVFENGSDSTFTVDHLRMISIVPIAEITFEPISFDQGFGGSE